MNSRAGSGATLARPLVCCSDCRGCLLAEPQDTHWPFSPALHSPPCAPPDPTVSTARPPWLTSLPGVSGKRHLFRGFPATSEAVSALVSVSQGPPTPTPCACGPARCDDQHILQRSFCHVEPARPAGRQAGREMEKQPLHGADGAIVFTASVWGASGLQSALPFLQ